MNRKIFMLFLIIVLLINGCSEKRTVGEVTADNTGTVPYTTEQMLMLVLSQKQKTDKVYTAEIWEKVLNNDITYNQEFLYEMKNFFCTMYQMRSMAEKRNLKLTADEKRNIDTLADSYYSQFVVSSESLKNMTKDETLQMFEEYLLATKMKNTIIAESDTEVSESEARVMDVERITLNDRESADNIQSLAAQNGDDFYNLAKDNSVDSNISLKLSRQDVGTDCANIIFELGDNEVSPVIEENDKFYIYKCTTSYNRDATALKKNVLQKERTREVVSEEYEKYNSAHEVHMDQDKWEQVVKRAGADFTGADFFTCIRGSIVDESI